MLGSQHPDKSAVGRKRTDSASASITEKANLQLLNEVEAMLSLPAEEMDTDRIEEYLSLLQKKAPVTEHYDPEEKWAKLEESHPLIFEEEPNSCKSDLAAEARNRHGNRTRRSFSRVFRAAAIAAAAAFCFIISCRLAPPQGCSTACRSLRSCAGTGYMPPAARCAPNSGLTCRHSGKAHRPRA